MLILPNILDAVGFQLRKIGGINCSRKQLKDNFKFSPVSFVGNRGWLGGGGGGGEGRGGGGTVS